jgi:hypothetical protein
MLDSRTIIARAYIRLRAVTLSWPLLLSINSRKILWRRKNKEYPSRRITSRKNPKIIWKI